MASLTVLGGSSVSTPLLLEAVGRAQAEGRLPQLSVRLWGRAAERMAGVAAHGKWRLRDVSGGELAISTHTELESALDGADVVLCQVRPGGFLGRSADEALALAEGIPGDEGLGPSGLACYLRGRPVLDGLAAAVARFAPRGVPYLQLTSPLGLTVARARREFGVQCYGVCELLGNTARKVCAAVEPKLGAGPLSVLYGGLNHQAWIHVFRDADGADRTAEVLAAIDDVRLTEVEPDVIRREGAVPVPYLRLYYHTARELQKQRGRSQTRGAELEGWATALETAYLGGDQPEIAALLGTRHINWYDEGVVPGLAAFLGDEVAEIALNLPGQGALPGANPEAVVELPCRVSRAGVSPVAVPPLPAGPAALTARLLRYEAAVLKLGERPAVAELTEVLGSHPLVPDAATAERLAGRMSTTCGQAGA